MTSPSTIDIVLDGIGHALSDRRPRVPIFQRAYAWEKEHVLDLLTDLDTAMTRGEPEYFLGSIVTVAEPDDRVMVVDGQQRLATISVFIAEIRNYFEQNNDAETANEIERKFLKGIDLRTKDTIAHLRLNSLDNDFYIRYILECDESALPSQPFPRESHQRIATAKRICFDYVGKIAARTTEPADALYDWLEYIEKKTRVIWVSVPSEANAFVIFETLNDRGLVLAISDLLKQYLFRLAGDRLDEVRTNWDFMAGTLASVGRENQLVAYIRHFWSSKHGPTREKELYNRIRSNIKTRRASIDLMVEIATEAQVYSAVLNPAHDFWEEYSVTARQHVETLNLLRMIQVRPLILAVVAHFSKKDVESSLRMLVSWSVRFLIHGGLGGGVMEDRYAQRAREVREGEIKTASELRKKMVGIVPNDDQFRSSFEAASVSVNYLARYYLRVLESGARGDQNPELVPDENQEKLNLEHVIPLRPGPEWRHVTEDMRRALVKRLGNMTLLATKLNSEAANSGWDEKRKIYGESQLAITKNLAEYDQWGPDEIAERQRKLASLALKAWPL